MLTSWLQCGQAAYTLHFRHSHSQKCGAVKSGECYGQLSCQIVNKLCWKYLQSYVVAIYVGLQNNIACMMCSYIYDQALYKISNIQQSSQSVTGTKSRPKEKLCRAINFFTFYKRITKTSGAYFRRHSTIKLRHAISTSWAWMSTMQELMVTGSYKLWQQGILQQQNVYRKFLENSLFNIVQKLKCRTNHTNTYTQTAR